MKYGKSTKYTIFLHKNIFLVPLGGIPSDICWTWRYLWASHTTKLYMYCITDAWNL